MAKRRYIAELTEAQIGVIKVGLDKAQIDAYDNLGGWATKTMLNNIDKALVQICKARDNGLKTIKS